MSPNERAKRYWVTMDGSTSVAKQIDILTTEFTTAIDEALAGALQDVADEEELDGPMPSHMRKAFMNDPEKTLRATVVSTKKSIAERIDRRRNALKEVPK